MSPKIRISNERLWEIAQSGDDINWWLNNNLEPGQWHEHFGVTALPYRSFSFDNDKDAVEFALRWL